MIPRLQRSFQALEPRTRMVLKVGIYETTLFFYRGRMMRLWGKCISRDAAGDIRSVAIVLTNEKEER